MFNMKVRYRLLLFLLIFSFCLSSGCIKENLFEPVGDPIVETEDLSLKFIMDDMRNPDTVVTIVTNHSDKAYLVRDQAGIIEKYDQGAWKHVMANTDPKYFIDEDEKENIKYEYVYTSGYYLLEPGQQFVNVYELNHTIHFRRGHYRAVLPYGVPGELREGTLDEFEHVMFLSYEFDIR